MATHPIELHRLIPFHPAHIPLRPHVHRKTSNRELSEKAATLNTLLIEAASLNEQINALKTEITAEFERREAEEIKVDGFLLRWTKCITSRFNSRGFKAAHPELSSEYTRQTEARRFTVTAA